MHETYVVTRCGSDVPVEWMPSGWEGKWHFATGTIFTFVGGEIPCFGNGANEPPTCFFRLTDRTEKRSDGEIALVWELQR